MLSHAANPVAEPISTSTIRVYFSTRDADRRSHITFLEFDISTLKVTKAPDNCLLHPGELGTFDDSGVAASWLVEHGGDTWMLYLGWNLGVTVPWRNSIGLARLNREKMILDRYSRAPLLDRCDADPYSISYPCTINDDGVTRIYYGSNLAWGKEQESMAHVIKYAAGADIFSIKREGVIAIPLTGDDYAISKPCVIKSANGYEMWYSHRGGKYRIGYATSKDAVNWTRRDDEVGITVSLDGWDSEMICYPFVFDHNGSRYMLYNGNGYGQSGFGLAIFEG